MRVKPIVNRTTPVVRMPGFYWQEIDAHLELTGRLVYLGMDPVSGLGQAGPQAQGYYAIFQKCETCPVLHEWGTLSVWSPRLPTDGLPGRKAGFCLRALAGRPVVTSGVFVFSQPSHLRYQAALEREKGGARCEV